MKALQLLRWKSAPEMREVRVPDPAPGQILVKVGGAGACHSDLHLMNEFETGTMPFEPPFTLGHENAGWVEALGPGVRGIEVGQPVAVYGPWGCGLCDRCARGMENYCERQAELGSYGPGLGNDGGMAPYLLVSNVRHLVPLDTLDPVHAAPLTDAGLTPYHAIKGSRPLLVPGTTAVAIGIGGLGHLGVQILREITSARIVAVDSRASALETAKEAGADHTVQAGESAAEEIREITRGRGADVVVDFVGSETTLRLAAAVTRTLGHVTIVGLAGGSIPVSAFGLPWECRVYSTYWGSIPELREVIALAEAGRIHAEVERFTLDQAMVAYEKMTSGKLQGRAVIVPG